MTGNKTMGTKTGCHSPVRTVLILKPVIPIPFGG